MATIRKWVQHLVRSLFSLRWLASLMMLLALDVCTYLALARTKGTHVFNHQDKVIHAAAFAFLTVLGYIALNFDFARRKVRFSVLLFSVNALVWIGYAAFIEVAQQVMGYRTASVGDLLADLVGILAGGLFLGLLKPFPREVEKRA